MNRLVLQKIINFRLLRLREGEYVLAKGTPQEFHARDEWTKAFITVVDDGHSDESYEWIKNQSIEIDKHGWQKWLDSDPPKIKYIEELLKPSLDEVCLSHH